MDKQRAEEIVDSLVLVNVNYHGIPVYIQEISANEETVTVFPLDDMDHVQQVDLPGLEEVKLTKSIPFS